MARRLALLTLLACAAAVRHPPHSADISDSKFLDPFSVWDDYDSSYETTPPPRTRTSTPSAKVLLKGKVPKVNVTRKNTKGEEKKLIKTTNINIESHTNFIVTKPPLGKPNLEGSGHPLLQIGDQYLLVESPDMEYVTKPTSRKPATTRKSGTTRKPGPTRKPGTTKKPTTTRQPVSRRPSSTRRTPTSTRRPTTRPNRGTKTTKAPYKRKTTKPPKRTGWLSSFFEENYLKKVPEKPAQSGWFVGIFSKVYNWLVKSKSSWSIFDYIWFFEDYTQNSRYTSTTPLPFTPAPSGWFQNLLANEDGDGAYILPDDSDTKKPKAAIKKNYKGYQLLRTYPDVQWKVHEMLELHEEAQGSGLMWWTMPSLNGSTDLLVPPDLLVDVKDHLKSNYIDYDVVIWDLQKAITYENPRLSKKQRIELEHLRGHPMTWRRYHRYADILRYLEYLQHSYSELVELIPLGRSSEGLPLVAVKISLSENDEHQNKDHKKKWRLQSQMKPAVWVDGGTHAREWIAPAVATWLIHALVEGEKGLGAEYEVLKQADFYIMPVLNPDGYEHSHTHDRLWRKTRSRQSDRSDDYYVGWFPWNWGNTDCVGVDADRNWDYHWSEKDSSTDPCADNYAGPNPFSEPETRAVSEFLAEHKGKIKLYLSLHAYSQAWLVPSSHSHEGFGDDGVLTEMGKLATVALGDLYGTKYQVGTAAEIRQPASGMSHDWAKARAGIKFSYHVDLRDSFGPYGFLLPGSQIVSTARETWQAIKAIVDNLSPGIPL